MGNSVKVALALGIGYFLGRSHKTRLALILAVGAATGGFGGVAKRMVTSGSKRLAASDTLGKLSPEFGNVVDSLKGDLADAGKAAAKAALSNRLDAVAESIHDRTEALRGQAAVPGGTVSAPGKPTDSGRADQWTEDGEPEGRQEHRDRPQRPPRQRPSGESRADRPRPSVRDRRPESARAGRPAPRDGGE